MCYFYDEIIEQSNKLFSTGLNFSYIFLDLGHSLLPTLVTPASSGLAYCLHRDGPVPALLPCQHCCRASTAVMAVCWKMNASIKISLCAASLSHQALKQKNILLVLNFLKKISLVSKCQLSQCQPLLAELIFLMEGQFQFCH